MNAFLSELRRRNVFRVAAAYLVGGWLVLQIVGAIEASAGLPAWTDGMALVLLMIGLPIALVIAWAFELTPEGLKKTSDESGDVAEARGVSVFDYVLLGGLVLVIVGIGAQALFMAPPETHGPGLAVAEPGEVAEVVVEPDAGPAENSIAVLAFADLSPDGDQEYFSDGMAEEILNVLVRVDGLAITSRTSAFQFKGQDIGIPEIAEQLNVRHIVEGSVRKADDTIRITAQLIDTQTDAHLWSQTYDSPLTTSNVFEIQDEISTAIVAALSEALGFGDVAEIEVETTTENLDAYDAYLRGQALFYQRSSTNFYEMIDLFEQSVAADPEFSRGWASLALAYSILPGWHLVDVADIHARVQAAADRASALDDRLALPYLARRAVAEREGNFELAAAAMAQARARDPDSLQVVYQSGIQWLRLGYLDRAIAAFEAALEIDPDYQIARRHLSQALIFSGETERGIELFETSFIAGQGSLLFDFASVYAGIDAPMTAYLLLVSDGVNTPDFAYFLHPYHRWQTDPEFSWADYRAALIFAHQQQFGTRPPIEIPELYEDGITDRNSEDYRTSNANVLWNPLLVDRRRPDLRDRYFEARKQKMRNMGLVAFWQANGFPSQCRAVGTDDFACD